MSNPTQGVLTVLGGVIGAYFGPAGASLGLTLGSAVGPTAYPRPDFAEHPHPSSGRPRVVAMERTP